MNLKAVRLFPILKQFTGQQVNFFCLRSLSGSSAPSPDVLKNYDRNVHVDIPRVNELARYPIPPLNGHYDEIMRRSFGWAIRFIETNEQMQKMVGENVPYWAASAFAHVEDKEFFFNLTRLMMVASYGKEMLDNLSSDEKSNLMSGAMELLPKIKDNELTDDDINTQPRALQMPLDVLKDARKFIKNEHGFRLLKAASGSMLTDDEEPKKQPITMEEYKEFVESGTQMTAVFTCAEASLNLVLDESVLEHPEMEQMHKTVIELLIAANDLRSFNSQQEKDQHWNNYITAYAYDKKITMQDAVAPLGKLIDSKLTEFQEQLKKLTESDLCKQTKGLNDYLEVAIPNLVYGTLYWGDITGRFRPDGVTWERYHAKVGDKIDKKDLYARTSL